MPRPPLIDHAVLEAAVVGLEQQRAEVEQKISAVRKQLRVGGAAKGESASPGAPPRKRRRIRAAR